jgi:hypothetical protein
MSDNLKDRSQQDRARIDVSQEHECRYWSEKFGVSAAELKSAVEKVGPMAKDVEAHLGSRNASGFSGSKSSK